MLLPCPPICCSSSQRWRSRCCPMPRGPSLPSYPGTRTRMLHQVEMRPNSAPYTVASISSHLGITCSDLSGCFQYHELPPCRQMGLVERLPTGKPQFYPHIPSPLERLPPPHPCSTFISCRGQGTSPSPSHPSLELPHREVGTQSLGLRFP